MSGTSDDAQASAINLEVEENSETEIVHDSSQKASELNRTETHVETHVEVETQESSAPESHELGSEQTSSTVMAVKTRRNRKPTEKGKQNRVNQLKTEISALVNSKLRTYEQALIDIDKQNFDTLAEYLEFLYVEQDGHDINTLCKQLRDMHEGRLDEQIESVCLDFNDELQSNIDFVNQLMDDIENAEEQLAMQAEEQLNKNLAAFQEAQKRQAEARRSILERAQQGRSLAQQNNSPMPVVSQNMHQGAADLNRGAAQEDSTSLPSSHQNASLSQSAYQPMHTQQAISTNVQRPGMSNTTDVALAPVSSSYNRLPSTGVRLKPSSATSLDNRRSEQAHNPTQSLHAITEPPTSDIKQLADTITASMKGTKRTIVEPSIFTGDPLKFKDWESDFDDFLETEGVVGNRRMRMLKKFIDGEAKECIEGFLVSDGTESYDDARKHLKERYGKRMNISRLLKAKLREWPKIQSKDGYGLQKFADFLAHLQSARKTVPQLTSIDEQEKNAEMLEKLPEWIKNKWKYKVRQYEVEYEDFPPFDTFKEFICEEAKSANILGVESPTTSSKKESESRKQGKNNPKKLETLQTSRSSAENDSKDKYCKKCNKDNHYTAQCNLLVKASYDEALAFFKQHRLCFNCGREGHRYDACPKKWKCKVCKREHPDCLHKTQQDWENSKSTASSTQQTQRSESKQRPDKQTGISQASVASSTSEPKSDKQPTKQQVAAATKANCKTELLNMLVPVNISTDGGKQATVYAMLDNGSDTTYITTRTIQTLNLKAKGQPEKVTMQTLNGEETSYRSQYEFKVRGVGPAADNSTYKITAFEQARIPYNDAHIPTRRITKTIRHLSHISYLISPKLDIEVEMLIGRDNSHLLAPHESIVGEPTEPFAVKTVLGWTLCGGSSEIIATQQSYCTVQQDEFRDLNDRNKMSQNDMKFLQILEEGTSQLEDGTMTLPLPFLKAPFMPNNRPQAAKRLELLISKFKKDQGLMEEYFSFMDDILNSGHAEPAPIDGPQGQTWYLPHLAVYHPKKRKLRVVFDASAKFQSKSLNEELLSGPEHINCLPGILLRFRKEPIAFSCDIQKMFHNFRVDTKDRDYLRFLWVDRDLETIKEYRMTVHLFGATSSPGVTTFALRKIANEASQDHPAAASFINKNFYVDDGIMSVASAKEAVSLIKDTIGICQSANLRLHKFISNSREVLKAIPESEKAENLQGLHLYEDTLPSERTLGLEWSTERDSFIFTSNMTEKPATKRGILSSVSQICDPLGFLAPFLLQGRIVMQRACQENQGWDDEVSLPLQARWKQWKHDLNNLDQICVPRCLKPTDFGDVKKAEIHYFSDASLDGYGACAYLRIINSRSNVHVTLIAAKSRVVPLKGLTIPRLELQAAVEATRLKALIGEELDISIDQEFFWSDSSAALGFVKNSVTPFQMFTANRVSEILRHSRPEQWYHVPGVENPADIASRGAPVSQLMTGTWYNGPKFLREVNINHRLNSNIDFKEAIEDSPEIRRKKTGLTTQIAEKTFSEVTIEKFSSWTNLVRAVANAKAMLQNRSFKKPEITKPELEAAEKVIILKEQSRAYPEEVNSLSSGKRISKSSKISSLTPFLDKEDNTLRMNSRATTLATYNEKHPVIIAKSTLAKLLISHYHELTHHQGFNPTVAAIRQAGFWVVGAPALAKSMIRSCVVCMKQRSRPLEQVMAPLPKERSEPSPPFTQIGIDTFGPFEVKDRRTVIKRWGLIFTCMYTRALHIELLEDLSTDSFLQALRRFEAIRGPVATIFCDGGTNFLGGRNQQERDLLTMTDSKLKKYMNEKRIVYKVNSPTASHQGGVWERQIRSIRSIMNTMYGKFSQRLTTGALRTAFYEIMAAINNRPLSGTSATDTEPIITANRLLTAKPSFTTPPPGDFDNEEVYGRSMYRKVQQLAQEFWQIWTAQYLPKIERRTQWKFPQPDLKVGDLVTIVEDNEHRNYWKTGRVISVHRGADQKVRKAFVIVGTSDLDKFGKPAKDRAILERPVQKLVRFMSC